MIRDFSVERCSSTTFIKVIYVRYTHYNSAQVDVSRGSKKKKCAARGLHHGPNFFYMNNI